MPPIAAALTGLWGLALTAYVAGAGYLCWRIASVLAGSSEPVFDGPAIGLAVSGAANLAVLTVATARAWGRAEEPRHRRRIIKAGIFGLVAPVLATVVAIAVWAMIWISMVVVFRPGP